MGKDNLANNAFRRGLGYEKNDKNIDKKQIKKLQAKNLIKKKTIETNTNDNEIEIEKQNINKIFDIKDISKSQLLKKKKPFKNKFCN